MERQLYKEIDYPHIFKTIVMDIGLRIIREDITDWGSVRYLVVEGQREKLDFLMHLYKFHVKQVTQLNEIYRLYKRPKKTFLITKEMMDKDE